MEEIIEHTEALSSVESVDGNLPEADQENLSEAHKMDDVVNTVSTEESVHQLTNINEVNEDLPEEITNDDGM